MYRIIDFSRQLAILGLRGPGATGQSLVGKGRSASSVDMITRMRKKLMESSRSMIHDPAAAVSI